MSFSFLLFSRGRQLSFAFSCTTRPWHFTTSHFAKHKTPKTKCFWGGESDAPGPASQTAPKLPGTAWGPKVHWKSSQCFSSACQMNLFMPCASLSLKCKFSLIVPATTFSFSKPMPGNEGNAVKQSKEMKTAIFILLYCGFHFLQRQAAF